jgi:hypothetical protein
MLLEEVLEGSTNTISHGRKLNWNLFWFCDQSAWWVSRHFACFLEDSIRRRCFGGLAPSVIGVIPYVGVNYFVYGSLRSLYKRCSKTNRVGNIQTLLIGSLARAIASTSTFPLEVARKHMQVRISTLTPSSTIRLYYSLNKSCVSHQFHQRFFIT